VLPSFLISLYISTTKSTVNCPFTYKPLRIVDPTLNGLPTSILISKPPEISDTRMFATPPPPPSKKNAAKPSHRATPRTWVTNYIQTLGGMASDTRTFVVLIEFSLIFYIINVTCNDFTRSTSTEQYRTILNKPNNTEPSRRIPNATGLPAKPNEKTTNHPKSPLITLLSPSSLCS
jgi:hypothetical protein